VAEWQLEALADQFIRKIPALVLVSAFHEMRGDDEWFRYDRAQLLMGTSTQIIRNQLLAGHVVVDLRLHDQGTRARNHGTGFRVRKDHLSALFKTVRELG
jgi:hypothetical protein